MDILIDGEITLYGVVGETWWTDEYFTAVDVMKAVAELKNNEVITVRCNSGGGAAFDGLAICNILKNTPNFIDLHVDGIAASAMSIICMGADRVTMHAGTSMMIHDAANTTSGNPEAHEKAAKRLHKLSDQCADVYAKKTSKLSSDAIRDLMREETWFNAQEALDAGFIDQIGDREAIAASLFDYREYMNAPKELVSIANAQANMFLSPELVKTPPLLQVERNEPVTKDVTQPDSLSTAEGDAVAAPIDIEKIKNDACDDERGRILAITTHEAAAGRSDLAAHLALKTKTPVEEAIATLQASPKKEAGPAQVEQPTSQIVEPLETMNGSGFKAPQVELDPNKIYADLNAK